MDDLDRSGVSAAPRRQPRQRDRRRALGDIVATLARLIAARTDPALLRGALEESLRCTIPARTIHLRDAQSRWESLAAEGAIESVAFEVPGPSPRMRGVLEATFDPGCQLGDWDFQLLAAAASLGSLILENERLRGQVTRAEVAARQKADGAAPLIGSTSAMRALRARIERVAATDFTVLLEGPKSR